MMWIDDLQKLQRLGTPTAIVTIIKTKGSTPREVGTKMLVTKKEFFGTIGGGQLEDLAIAKARDMLRLQSEPERVPYPLCLKANQCCGGFVEVFIETLNTQPQVYIFGAGHVGQAVVNVLNGTPFQTRLIDDRADWLAKAPAFTNTHQDSGLKFIEEYPHWSAKNSYAVVMTYDHDLDQALVEKLLEKPLAYLGLIGSKTKWLRFQKRLEEKGITTESLQKVTCPIGLDIGGKTPQEVAISLAAELVQMHNATLRQSKPQEKTPSEAEEIWMEELA